MAGTAKDKTEDVVETAEVTLTPEEQAAQVIRRNILWSMGAGIIPVAFVDTAAIMAVQVKLLKELADVYGIPFRANAGKSAVAALLGGLTASGASSGLLATGMFHGLIRSVPVVGPLIGWATLPGFAAAVTYAVGRVFDQHFASGGTFLTFDPKRSRDISARSSTKPKSGGPARPPRKLPDIGSPRGRDRRVT